MELLLWIIFGGIAGWVASTVMNSDNGLLWDISLGIVGAIMGGFIMSLFGMPVVNGFNLYGLLVAIIGASVLIWVGQRLHIGYR